MFNIVYPFIIVLMLFILGCENNIAEDQINEPEDCTNVESYYAEAVMPIMEQNCTGCHSGVAPSGGLGLDSYSSVRNSMSSTLDRVNLDQGSSGFMPQGSSKLTENELSILQIFFEMECE